MKIIDISRHFPHRILRQIKQIEEVLSWWCGGENLWRGGGEVGNEMFESHFDVVPLRCRRQLSSTGQRKHKKV